MKVNISKKLVEQFRRSAVKYFPMERFAFLIGKREDDVVAVKGLFFPLQEATDLEVIVEKDEHVAAMQYAANVKCIVVGSIHSHTYAWDDHRGHAYEPVMSIGDSLTWGTTDLVCGIMNLVEAEDGKRYSDLAFWGEPTMCELQLK